MSSDTSTTIIKGYKATDKHMQCRGFQFKLGKWFKHDGPVAMCESGFHFCEYPSGPWSFYSDEGTRIFEVEARGVVFGDEPGAARKHAAAEIRLVKEIFPDGDRNTGNRNTGNRNTGDYNTGYGNTGYGNTGGYNTGSDNTGNNNTGNRNTGNRNTGDYNTGNRNTGDYNTGNRNTGDYNTGDYNTGDYNTGDYNTGNGNATDKCAGHLCAKEQPVILFDKKVPVGAYIPWDRVDDLCHLMRQDAPIENIEHFLAIPNATEKKIRALHAAHVARRTELKKQQ